MSALSEYTPTQLLKMINDSKVKHECMKKEILEFTDEVETLEMKINVRLDVLSKIEQQYVELIEELNNRENVSR